MNFPNVRSAFKGGRRLRQTPRRLKTAAGRDRVCLYGDGWIACICSGPTAEIGGHELPGCPTSTPFGRDEDWRHPSYRAVFHPLHVIRHGNPNISSAEFGLDSATDTSMPNGDEATKNRSRSSNDMNLKGAQSRLVDSPPSEDASRAYWDGLEYEIVSWGTMPDDTSDMDQVNIYGRCLNEALPPVSFALRRQLMTLETAAMYTGQQLMPLSLLKFRPDRDRHAGRGLGLRRPSRPAVTTRAIAKVGAHKALGERTGQYPVL